MTYLVFIRRVGGRTWYLAAGAEAGAEMGWTQNRTKAEKFTRAEVVRQVRDLFTKVDEGTAAGFEGA